MTSRITVTHDTLVDVCRRFGPLVQVPAGIDGAQLLWAIAGNESSFGLNCTPRHEPGYCRGGRYFDASLTAQWGCLAHCSFGWGQIMFPNARGHSPLELLTDPASVAEVLIGFLNREILGRQQATTLEQIADAYNSGNWRDANVPRKYITDFLTHYRVPLQDAPQETAHA